MKENDQNVQVEVSEHTLQKWQNIVDIIAELIGVPFWDFQFFYQTKNHLVQFVNLTIRRKPILNLVVRSKSVQII